MLFENLLTSINKLVWKENLKCLINLRNDLFGDRFKLFPIEVVLPRSLNILKAATCLKIFTEAFDNFKSKMRHHKIKKSSLCLVI